MCKHKLVEMPVSYSGKPVTKDWIFAQGLGCLQVPFDLGSFRKLKERCDGARHTCYAVDIVFNPLIVQLFMDDEFCNKMEQYRQWVLNMAVKRVDESIGVRLSTQKVKLVKSLRYKDGETDGTPREFTELPSERDMDLDSDIPPPAKKTAPDADDKPLSQEVTPNGRRKPAVKKGFLNSKDSAPLYPEGSKEGVLPENAGDPMGWMPKKLRQNSKIIDCNSPEYQENERKKKAAEEANNQNKEFRDSLLQGFDSFAKKQSRDIWEHGDLPEGTEEPPKCKYDNDYSRFDLIEDVAPEPAPGMEPRDYYFDEHGKRHQINSKPMPKAGGFADEESTPAVKKGFFGDSKKPLYPPEGSEQKSPMAEEELMKELGSFLKENESRGAPQANGAPVPTPVKAKRPELLDPDYALTEVGDNLQLVVTVPNLTSMQGVDLDVTEQRASLAFPPSAGMRPLQVELPVHVVPTSVRAKFSKKARQITVRMPLAAATA
jgi:hypothetical protein